MDHKRSSGHGLLWHIAMSDAAHDFSVAAEHSDVRILANDGAVLWYEAHALRANTSKVLAAAVAADGEHEIKLDTFGSSIQDYLNVVSRPPSMRKIWLNARFADSKDRAARICDLASLARKCGDENVAELCGAMLLFEERQPDAKTDEIGRLLDKIVIIRTIRARRAESSANTIIDRMCDMFTREDLKKDDSVVYRMISESEELGVYIPYVAELSDRAVGACAMILSIRITGRPGPSGALRIPEYTTDTRRVPDWLFVNRAGARIVAAMTYIRIAKIEFNRAQDVVAYNDRYRIWTDLSWLAQRE